MGGWRELGLERVAVRGYSRALEKALGVRVKGSKCELQLG